MHVVWWAKTIFEQCEVGEPDLQGHIDTIAEKLQTDSFIELGTFWKRMEKHESAELQIFLRDRAETFKYQLEIKTEKAIMHMWKVMYDELKEYADYDTVINLAEDSIKELRATFHQLGVSLETSSVPHAKTGPTDGYITNLTIGLSGMKLTKLTDS
ncbi:hypothetical protein LZ30DRAFT_694337 [Colletotrichum cereale]|nr:hypothetical protein LZ30DRAFT_694337 [Colletotrichum cereale]